jgi:cell division septation protein DedD
MLIRCPQCQYANQVEADATKPRIVCARCATVISIEFLSSPGAPPVFDSYDEGRGLAGQSFMKTPESPLDLDSLLETPVEVASNQPAQPLPPPAVPVGVNPLVQTPLAAESRWDSDEILDIPRAAAATAQQQENPLAVEDLFAAPPSPPTASPAYSEPVYSDAVLEPMADSAAAGAWGASDSFARADDPLDLEAEPPSAYDAGTASQFANYSGEAIIDTEEPARQPESSVFAQDSYVRSGGSTYVMATPDRTKGRLAKIFLAAALCFALLGVGYFTLSNLVKDWLGLRGDKQTTATATAPVGATPGKPEATPSAVPSLGSKVGASPSPTASVAASPSATATPSAKPSATPTATVTPAANQNATSKPTPAPPQTGTSGHAVSSSDGSLTIQVASYKTAGEAQQVVTRLKGAGVDARVVKAEVPGKGTWYRVQAGRFTTEADASKYAGELRAKGAVRDFIVTGYQNE